MMDKMKNIILSMLFVSGIAFSGNTQVTFGAGLTFLEELGVQVRSDIEFDNFSMIPKFSYYIVDDQTSISFELDAAYTLLTFADENPVYLFGGPALYRRSQNGFSNSDFGVTIGGGLEISGIYGEIKYTNTSSGEN